MRKIESLKETELALFRYSVISGLVTEPNLYKSDHKFFKMASEKTYILNGEKVSFSESTIERWFYNYKKFGLDGLQAKKRTDFGKMRKVTAEIIDFVANTVLKFPRIPATQIFDDLKKEGFSNISLSTVNRLVNNLKKENNISITDQMLRYEREHINEVWCGDTTVIWSDSLNDNKVTKLYVIALIDDASRKIVSARVYLNDNAINLVDTLKYGILKSGIPSVLNFDNGKNYRCKQMEIIAAKLSSRIHYCAPYTPTAKAKIERWFKTLKDHWNCSGLKTIEEIQASLDSYVNKYNTSEHSTIKMTPIERFNKELKIVRYLKDGDKNKAFLFEIERKVSPDGVVKVEQKEYEVNYKFQNQRVKIFYEPNLSHVYVKDNAELVEIFLLNKVNNSLVKRTKVTNVYGEVKNHE